MYRSVRFISLALILVALVSAIGFAQLVQFRQPITITSAGAPGQVDVLWVGVHGDGPGGILDNTYAADVDELLYFPPWLEMPNPPDPPEFRLISKFIQIPGRSAGIGSTGIKPDDYRDYRNAAQVDTFHITVYGDASDSAWVARGPITISWPATLGLNATQYELKRRVGTAGNNYATVVANMVGAAGTYVDENNDPITGPLNSQRYLLIKTGAFMPPPGPFCYPAQTTLALGNVTSEVTTSTISIANTGADNALVISGITAPAGYTAVMSNMTIAPLTSQTLTVTFTAGAAGVYAGDIAISHNGVAPTVAPTNIAVSATVIDPTIVAVPTTVAFGTVPYPQVRTAPLALTNASPLRAVSISSITLPTGSSIAPAITSIAPGATANLTVTFTTLPAGGSQGGNIVIAGNAPTSIPLTGISQVQGGKLAFAAPAITVLDNSFNGAGDANGGAGTDGYYTATIGLHEYSGQALKNIQFTLVTNGKVIGYQLVKQAKVLGWNLSSKIMRGSVQPDGSSNDSINVVLWSLGADVLDTTGIAAAPLPLLTFGFDVVNINVNTATTTMQLTKILGSTNTFVDAQLNEDALQTITITNRINRGDVNNDDRVDILDLLMIVDHITGKAPLTPGSDAFIAADVAGPWPVADGAVNVMDLAQLQSIILNNAYPDGNPLLGAKSVLAEGLAKESIELILHVDPKGKELALELVNTSLVRGCQVDVDGVISAKTASGQELSGNATGFQNGRLTIIGKTAQALQAGKHIIARIAATFRPADVMFGENIIVVDNEGKAVNFGKSIVYDKAFDPTLPTQYALEQNFPNPFNPSTRINIAVPELSQVRVVVYNMLGQEVATLVNREMAAGRYPLEWNGMSSNGHAIATGTYIYRMTAGNFVETKKMMFLK